MTLADELTTLKAGVVSLAGSAENFIKNNLGIIGAGVGGVAVGSALGAITATTILKSGSTSSTKRKSSKKRKSTRRTHKRKVTHHRRRKAKYARTAGKRKDTSHRRIRMTKNGQPYVILASGKARFIKKSSAHNSRKRKGGKY